VIGRVTFASGEQQEYTDAETFLQCIRDELPNHPVTGFRYETLTDDPAIRKQVDDILYDLYGEENPRVRCRRYFPACPWCRTALGDTDLSSL